MNTTFKVPVRDEVSAANQTIFDSVKKSMGFVPNLYASFAHSEHALGTFLAAQGAKSSLTAKEKEIVNLVVSQVNDCKYCLSAHSAVAKMNGFTDDQILEIRSGAVSFDQKYDALAKFAKSLAANKGQADGSATDQFFAQGYTKENLIDTIMLAGIRTITNYVYAVTQPEVDFPAVPEIV
jgi:uncharacterized peroxidase-related enzyme